MIVASSAGIQLSLFLLPETERQYEFVLEIAAPTALEDPGFRMLQFKAL